MQLTLPANTQRLIYAVYALGFLWNTHPRQSVFFLANQHRFAVGQSFDTNNLTQTIFLSIFIYSCCEKQQERHQVTAFPKYWFDWHEGHIRMLILLLFSDLLLHQVLFEPSIPCGTILCQFCISFFNWEYTVAHCHIYGATIADRTYCVKKRLGRKVKSTMRICTCMWLDCWFHSSLEATQWTAG